MNKIDHNFIEALKKDEDKAWESVYRYCYKHALHYIKHPQEAEDIASKACVSIKNKIGDYKPEKGKGNLESNFKAYARKIVFNSYLDLREERQREATFDLLSNALGLDNTDRELIESSAENMDRLLSLKAYEDSTDRNNPEWNLAAKEVLEMVNLIKEPRKRIALLLKYLYDYKTHEIANLMKENFDSIQTLIHRTRAEMKTIYEGEGIDQGYLAPETWRIGHLIH